MMNAKGEEKNDTIPEGNGQDPIVVPAASDATATAGGGGGTATVVATKDRMMDEDKKPNPKEEVVVEEEEEGKNEEEMSQNHQPRPPPPPSTPQEDSSFTTGIHPDLLALENAIAVALTTDPSESTTTTTTTTKGKTSAVMDDKGADPQAMREGETTEHFDGTETIPSSSSSPPTLPPKHAPTTTTRNSFAMATIAETTTATTMLPSPTTKEQEQHRSSVTTTTKFPTTNNNRRVSCERNSSSMQLRRISMEIEIRLISDHASEFHYDDDDDDDEDENNDSNDESNNHHLLLEGGGTSTTTGPSPEDEQQEQEQQQAQEHHENTWNSIRRSIRASTHHGHHGHHGHNDGNDVSMKEQCWYWWCFLPSLLWCLSPKYKLRTQLMLSFGIVNIGTVLLVVIGCIVVTLLIGENIKTINQNAFEQKLVPEVQHTTNQYLAESLEKEFIPLDVIDIVVEATLDRYQGYPMSLYYNNNNNENDNDDEEELIDTTQIPFRETILKVGQVPFRDAITGKHIYPIVGTPMPLDWQVPPDVTVDNYEEHLQSYRWESFYKLYQPIVSTTNAVFLMQGACDPNEINPLSPTYWSNCTDANNDITTGGIMNPMNSTEPIYRMGADLVPLLKAMVEAKPEIRDIGLYFMNGGAGVTINYPAYPMNTQTNYTSIGCDWMATPNPLDPSLGPIGTPEEIQRCHPTGETVSNRLYNPLERGWCRDQALNPGMTLTDSYIDAWTPGHWMLSIGRAIYDRQTKEFIACTYVGISLSLMEEKLRDALLTDNSELTVIRFDQRGTVISSTAKDALAGETDGDVYTIGELNVGLSDKSYRQLYELVNFNQSSMDEPWHPDDVNAAYRDFSVLEGGFLIAVSPMPQIPNHYDPQYRPEFFVIMSTATEDVFEGVKDLNDAVDGSVRRVFWFSLIAGLIGLGATTLVIILISNALTAPLHYINDSADDIVRSFGHTTNEKKKHFSLFGGGTTDENATQQRKALKFWAPTTELTEVLEEYKRMVDHFSGSLLAKAEKGKRVEVRNRFNLREEFAALYASRTADGFKYRLDVPSSSRSGNTTPLKTAEATAVADSFPGLVHTECLTVPKKKSAHPTGNPSNYHLEKNRFSSRLFFWTVALIAVPLLLTTTTISVFVYFTARPDFDQSIDNAEQYYVSVKVDALAVDATLRAKVVASLVAVSVRDLYLVTRYMGWLLFGGLTRADTFTEITTGSGPCKAYQNDMSKCPYFQNEYICDCSWNDNRGPCENFASGSRHLQRAVFSVESSDAMPDGDRNFSSFPEVSNSPITTEWWNDATTVPGWEKGSTAAGYDTLYDRLRVFSAMPLFPVLFNYDHKKENYIGQSVAFEADGLMSGYSGCGSMDVDLRYSEWKSTEDNGAAELRPELCPLGKHGYDPRCRSWYDVGRKRSADNVTLHITAPYMFAGSNLNAQSATSPLIDPRTGQHVGQVLQDFYSNSVFEALDGKNTLLSEGGFPILIAVQGDPKNNAVMGPDFEIGDDPKEIAQVVLPFDFNCESQTCQTRLQEFDDIVTSMKSKQTNANFFTRTNSDDETDTVYIAYAPVVIQNMRPLDSSNFARGGISQDYFTYSVGLSETEKGILQPFKQIEKDMKRQIKAAILALLFGILISAILTAYISYLVTASITEPMLYLLELIRCINRNDFDGEPPRIEHSKGSSELTKVSATVLVLYKIVRAANDLFFEGKLDMAYFVLVESLKLFKKLENKKAVAVASNNLGNTMFIMFREMTWLGLPKHGGMTKNEILTMGTAHFNEAIKLGEEAYDEFYQAEGWTPNCLDFMQHLSNRYFNRALFLLTVKDETKDPDEIQMLGVRDLEIARDMDLEIGEYGEDIGFNRESRAHKLFTAQLVRARGHNTLLEMGYPDADMLEKGYPEDWELDKRLDEIFEILRAENEKGASSELFLDVSVLGRLQDIEAQLMKYKKVTGDLETAAKIAIRVLHEDGCVFADTLFIAIDVLLAFSKEKMECDDGTRERLILELQGYARSLDEDLGKLEAADQELQQASSKFDSEPLASSRISSIQDGESSRSSSALRTSLINWVRNENSGGFVTMEDF